MHHSISIFSALLIIALLTGCDTGDDLSQPLPGPQPVTEWKFTTESKAVIADDTTYAVSYWEGDALKEVEFYILKEDTIYLRGSQMPGSQIVEKNAVFSPAVPIVGTQWWGPGSHRYSVTDSAEVTVPAGSFPAYVYQISDSTTGEDLGELVLSEAAGILSRVQFLSEETISIVLDSVTIAGGEGVFPLALGNEWVLVEGFYEIE